MVKGIHLTGCALAVLLLLGITGRASATPGDTLGFGTRNINLGGAVTADVEDVGATTTTRRASCAARACASRSAMCP
jgi:hypothetical protein